MKRSSAGVLGLWRDQLIAADPGLGRLRFAARITLSVGLTLLALLVLAGLTGQSFFVFFIGVAVAMVAASAVTDKTPAAQRLTMLLLPLPAALAVTLGGLVSSSLYLGEAVFVAVMFLAVYVRRFGPRWFAFGMVAFLSYFFALFVRARPAQLPWMLLALAVAVACTYALHFWLLSDRAPAGVAQVLPAVRAQIRLLLHDLARVAAGESGAGLFRQARHRVVQLNEIVLIPNDELLPGGPQRALFEAELAVQRLVAMVRRAGGAGAPPVLHDLDALRSALGRRGPLAEAVPWQTSEGDPFGAVLRDLADALASDVLRRPAMERPAEEAMAAGAPAEPEEGEAGAAPQEGLRPTTRQAIQVAAASILAIIGGAIISPVRWYWAVITAFIVFTGTSTRGDVFVKGWRRVAGTLAGVVIGVLVAKAVDGDTALALALIFVCIFLGFYLLRLSYTLMIFWITILLALLYELLGSFSVGLLALRLEETVLGAAVGIAVAMFLLPAKTQPMVRQASRAFLLSLGGVLDACRQERSRGGTGGETLSRVRELDQSFQKLRQQAAPLNFRVPGTSIRNSHRWLRVLLTLLYEAHNLARLCGEVGPPPDEARLAAMSRLQERIETLAEAVASGRASPVGRGALGRARQIPVFEEVALGSEGRHLPALARCLLRIDWIVAVLANDLGITEEAGLDGVRAVGAGEVSQDVS